MDSAALARFWGPLSAPPHLVAQRENTVFAVTFADGRKAALRLHRPGYRSRAEVLAELEWTESLASRGFPCPVPLRTVAGQFLPAEGPLVSAVAWMEGAAPREAEAATPEHAHDLGRLLGRLHAAADASHLPPPQGPGWTLDSLLGPEPRTGRFWESPALTPQDADLLGAARKALREAVPHLSASGSGFVHGDPLRENLLCGALGLALIDFDDCGWGLRGFDLGSALIQTALLPGAAERAAALAEGYGSPDLAAELPAWVLLRGLASCGWAVSRLPADDPRIPAYAARAVDLAHIWLD